jgi:hypothetical protein
MMWEAVTFAVLGLLAAWTASRVFPLRLPVTPLLLATGPAAALTGGLVTYTVLGGGYPEATFPAAALTAAVLISLLARPPKRGRHAKMRATNA